MARVEGDAIVHRGRDRRRMIDMLEGRLILDLRRYHIMGLRRHLIRAWRHIIIIVIVQIPLSREIRRSLVLVGLAILYHC